MCNDFNTYKFSTYWWKFWFQTCPCRTVTARFFTMKIEKILKGNFEIWKCCVGHRHPHCFKTCSILRTYLLFLDKASGFLDTLNTQWDKGFIIFFFLTLFVAIHLTRWTTCTPNIQNSGILYLVQRKIVWDCTFKCQVLRHQTL